MFAQKRKVSVWMRCWRPHFLLVFFVLLKTKIQLSKFEDLVGFVESLTKGAASHLVNNRGAPRSLQWKGFIGRNWTKQES